MSFTMTKTKTVIFSLIPVIILLLMLEITGRIIYPFDQAERGRMLAKKDPRRDIPTWENASGQVILEDIFGMDKRYLSYLGFLGAPNSKMATFEINEIGFRDSAVEPRVPNEYRILILGGSAAWGWGASANRHTISGALQELLNEDSSGVSYRVMNGSYLAWTSLQERITLMEFYERFDPDLVVSFTGFNDIISVQYGNSRELLRLEFNMVEDAVENNLKPMGTLKAIRKVVGSLGIWRLVVYIREQLHSGKSGGSIDYKPERSSRGVPKILDRYLSMANYTASHGDQFLLALQPDIYTTGKQLTAPEAEVKQWLDSRNSENFDNTFIQYRSDLVQGLTALPSSGINVIDLAPVFDDVSETMFTDDSHFNDSGYRGIARALHDVIKKNHDYDVNDVEVP
jgi:lysophospholipase L1-like esterase